ncbi:MAG: hypothetical protein ACXADY_25345 [Candidatus Hodarchaeales archaeon]|jgi:hypothetical protein
MSRDYVRIYRAEFDKFMTKFNAEQITPRGTSEIVYRIILGNELSIWIYSSIRRKSGVSRPAGKDAIRTIMLYQENHGVMKESKTLRTSNWEKNLEKKIRSLQKRATTYQCPWGHPLVKRKRKSGRGLFTSCAVYPKCKYIYSREKPIVEIYDPENIPPLPETFIQRFLRLIRLRKG